MNEHDPKTRFQVVPKRQRSEVSAEAFLVSNVAAQSNLFPIPRAGLLIFVFFPEVTEDEFRKTLEMAKPSVVVELRSTPRFDIGRLNRQTVFQYFDREHSKYLDLTSKQVDETGGLDLIQEVRESFTKNHVRFDKPIMFLLSRHSSTPELSERIVGVVSELKKTPPEVLEIPHFVSGLK